MLNLLAALQDFIYRSKLLELFCEIGVLKTFAKFKEKHLCQSLFLIKLQAEAQAQMFSCEFSKIFNSSFFIEHLRLFCILNPGDCVWWRFLQKYLTAFTHWLFFGKSHSIDFCKVLNTPLLSK